MQTLTLATWNVNGIRARKSEVAEFLATERPDVLCLQEIKARPEQVPEEIREPREYRAFWHGAGGYSGVALLVRKDAFPSRLEVVVPSFDFETRLLEVRAGDLLFLSAYVPNGGKDFEAKMRFLRTLEDYVRKLRAGGNPVAVCGDLNVTREDRDVHPKERNPQLLGQRPEERAELEKLLAAGLSDVTRTFHPEDERLFTWWAPWRRHRERNIGWRLDYILLDPWLASRARSCTVRREFGSSDHAPVVATLEV
ncbi:MAG: exodeoxyribonuclease III [Candidatus Binatia bacterium]|nr:MAG: exodeoxyribonuclease III [Candidatus Binatia bacterium]